MELARRVKTQRLRWLAHVVRIDGQAPARRVFETDPSGGSRRRGRPCTDWRDQVEYDVSSLGISNWRHIAGGRSDWRALLNEA